MMKKDSISEFFEDINIDENNKKNQNSESLGNVCSNINVANNIYGETTHAGKSRFSGPRGYGFAAERANNNYDKIQGKDARILGDDNAKNGADRISNGVEIQSKYCATGSKCISECFENGKYRYFSSNGEPMQIEVPADMYDDAVRAMSDRIRRGEVPGITDPEESKNIVRKGHVTYQQAKKIAEAGTIDSLKYDATNGIITATSTAGVTAIITFASSIWNGETVDTALKNSVLSGLKVGGVSFVVSVIAGQASKAGLNTALVGSSEMIVNAIGPKASATLVNSFREGSNIYGATAMKSAAKMLRSNVIVGAISIVVLSTVDISRAFNGKISVKQLFKNVVNTTAGVAGGTAGAVAGAAIGSVIPVVGTVVGGILGGVCGGIVSGNTSKMIMDKFIEDDAEEMLSILEFVLERLAIEYLLNKKELNEVIFRLKKELDINKLREMFTSMNKERYAERILIPKIENVLFNRKKIKIPTEKEYIEEIKYILGSF